MPRKPRAHTLEQSLAELEQLVVQLERGDTSLDEALTLFATGIALTRHCQQALQAAEQKVDILIGDKVEPFNLLLQEPSEQDNTAQDTDDAIKNFDD